MKIHLQRCNHIARGDDGSPTNYWLPMAQCGSPATNNYLTRNPADVTCRRCLNFIEKTTGNN